MDITLHIMIKPADHQLDDIRAARRYRSGDILDVYLATKYATLQPDGNYLLDKPPGHPRFGFIHIKGVPDTLDKRRIKEKLLSQVTILNETVRRKEWHIPPEILPQAFKLKLLEDKQVTVNFDTAKAYIRRKTTPVILDPDSDDISTAVTVEDLQ